MRHIIIGIRERIGKCVHTFFCNIDGSVVSGIDDGDRVVEREYLCECVHGDEFDMMHVCILFSDAERFYKDVSYYIKAYPSKHVVIYSLGLPVGMYERFGDNVCYSPIDGKQWELFEGFKTSKRIISGKDSEVVGSYFKGWGLEVESH